MAVLYGNCQVGIIEKMLNMYSAFRNDYVTVSIPRVCEYEREHGKKLWDTLLGVRVFWKNIDLFIYQHVNSDNRFFI